MNTSEMLAMASTEISNLRRELAEKDVLIERLRDALAEAEKEMEKRKPAGKNKK